MKKTIGIFLILLVAYNSVYFKKLSLMQDASNNATSITKRVDDLYQKGIIENTLQTELGIFIQQMNQNSDSVFFAKGNIMGIGSSRCFLVNGKAQILSIQDGQLSLSNGSTLDTKYIFGNELRDASRFLQLSEFHSQKDLNQLTEALNNQIREKILPNQVAKLHVGDLISFIGACQLSKKELPISHLTIFPALIK